MVRGLERKTRLLEKWTTVGNTQIIGTHSRFEVDLNRPREKAVYIKPEDAWGLEVWKYKPSQELVIRSLVRIRCFLFNGGIKYSPRLEKQFGRFCSIRFALL